MSIPDSDLIISDRASQIVNKFGEAASKRPDDLSDVEALQHDLNAYASAKQDLHRLINELETELAKARKEEFKS